MYRALAIIRGAGGGVLAAVYAMAGVVGEPNPVPEGSSVNSLRLRACRSGHS
jgi:hypothetical protein